MRTLLPDPPPADIAVLLERRKRLGQDRKDEVWEGVLHVVPAPDVRHALISQQLAEILGASARAGGLTATIAEFNLGEAASDFESPTAGFTEPARTASGCQRPR